MTTPDTDCNRVAYFPQFPDVTQRCTQPEGHADVEPCWLRDPASMRHKHRAPRPTFTDPFDVVPRGGTHRRTALVSGVQGAATELHRRLALATGGVR